MPPPSDPDLAKRSSLLSGIALRLGAARIPASFTPLEPYGGFRGGPPEGVTGLVCRQATTTATAQVTVTRAISPVARDGRGQPDPAASSAQNRTALDYRIDGAGDLYFEVTILEDPDGGSGHGQRSPVQRFLTGDEQAVVDAILLWYGHRDTLRCARPQPPNPRDTAVRRQRDAARRDAAAARPDVRIAADFSAVPAERRTLLAADLDAIDPRALCWQFPRKRGGRYAQRAVVSLAGYGGHPARREPWLIARAVGDTLIIDVEHLIGANQEYRWDATPWLWRRDHAGTSAEIRWGLADLDALPGLTGLLDANRIGEALARSRVGVDGDIAALLDGYPTRYLRARYTETWVNKLYLELRAAAPWRFGWAYQVWQADRRARRPVDRPVVLCGLTGLNQVRRPALALARRRGALRLEMVWTASNARLSRALWQRPPDLDAALCGRHDGGRHDGGRHDGGQDGGGQDGIRRAR